MSKTAKRLRPLQLAAVIFLTVSGGPYGLEPLLEHAGRNGAILLLLITPLVWDIPAILTVMELNSMMPVKGGYYQWVKRALGTRMAFYEGWWTWLYTFTDLAIYPVLFATYLNYFFPELAPFKIPLCLAVIWICAGVNILGIVPVGKVSMILGAMVLIPFAALFGIAFWHNQGHFSIPKPSLDGLSFSSIGLGLYVVMWNFIGWDNATTYAEEVDNPVRSYLKAVGIAFVTTIVVYFLAIITAQQSGIDYKSLSENGWPVLGVLLAGKWLGVALGIGGLASTFGIFSAVLLSVSRVPKVMADDGFLPARLQKEHSRFGTPYISIIICAFVVSGMILWGFSDLLIIDIIVYGAGLFLEFISLVVFRIKLPDEPRPFKIPFGIKGICAMLLLPVCVYGIALVAACTTSEKTFWPAIFAIILLISAEIAWQIVQFWKRRKLRLAQ